jgi:hypothetical protein
MSAEQNIVTAESEALVKRRCSMVCRTDFERKRYQLRGP